MVPLKTIRLHTLTCNKMQLNYPSMSKEEVRELKKNLRNNIRSTKKYDRLNYTIFYGSTALVGQNLLLFEVSRSHLDTPHSAALPWKSDRSVAETYTR
jgi:hypothetical protein